MMARVRQNGFSPHQEFIQSVRQTLAADKFIRRKMPQWGQLHIDRKQPFLCVYRKPPDRDDVGTDRLIVGQASHLLADGDPALHMQTRSLTLAIIEELSLSFGGVLLLELWSEPVMKSGEPDAPPRFHIVAPMYDAPGPILEMLESSLLAHRWRGEVPGIEVDYRDVCAPPCCPPLIPRTQARKLNCTVLGLGISSFYRDCRQNKIYPGILTATRHALGHVLKQTFFAYTHIRPMKRPSHYHELGREAMTQAVRETDRRLAKLSDSYSLLLHATPVNAKAAWRAFKRSAFERTPEFHYRPQTMDLAQAKFELYRIPLENIEDPTLHHIFAEKRDEMDREITMIGDRGTSRFLYGGQQIFGAVDAELIGEAERILASVPPGSVLAPPGPPLDASEFAGVAEKELAFFRDQYPDFPGGVELRTDVPGIMVSHGKLLIGRDAHVERERVNATITLAIGPSKVNSSLTVFGYPHFLLAARHRPI